MTARRQEPPPTIAEHPVVPLPAEKTRAGAEGGSSKRHFYKPLPKEFRHHGFDYRQIARERSAAIYQQIWISCFNAAVCYEVVRIRRREGFHTGDRFVEPAEVYPNSEAWGVDGWTAEDKDTAFRKLQTLVIERVRTFRAKRSAAVSSDIQSE